MEKCDTVDKDFNIFYQNNECALPSSLDLFKMSSNFHIILKSLNVLKLISEILDN